MKIRCSESTYQLIKKVKILNFIPDKIEAKGLGVLTTFFIELKDINDEENIGGIS